MGRCSGCEQLVGNSTCACGIQADEGIEILGNGNAGSPYLIGAKVNPSASNILTKGAAGLYVPEDISHDGALDEYDPDWTSTGSDPVLGNGTLLGFYKAMGRHVHVAIVLTFGSSTNGGSGAWLISLPFAWSGQIDQVLPVWVDNSGTRQGGVGLIPSGGGTVGRFAGGTAVATGWGPTTPFTWGAGDRLVVSGTYWRD